MAGVGLTLMIFSVTSHLNSWDPERREDVGYRLLNNLESLQYQFSRASLHQCGGLL